MTSNDFFTFRIDTRIEAPLVPGRPKTHDPDKLLLPLKAIRLHALQPCGLRLKGAPGDWLRACENDHRRLDTDVRRALLEASRATLDRLPVAVRVQHRRRATTRPGPLLRHQIPICTDWDWNENAPGFLEVDTVAMRGIWKSAGVIFGGGTGNPYFSSDIVAALRANEIGAEVILNAAKADGIYDSDPQKNPKARRFAKISHLDALKSGSG